MASGEGKGILGVSLVGDQLRMVEGIRESASEFRVTKAAQGRIRQPFDFESFADKNMPRRFADDISRLHESQGFGVKAVAFSLDSRMVLVKRLAIDKGLQSDHIASHVDWEVRQFAISPVNEYIVDYEKLTTGMNGSLENMLVVIVRKKVVQFLRQVFDNTDLQLKVIDVDVFSAQRALQLNYDYNEGDTVCLIGIEDSKIHFSVLTGRNFYLTHEATALGKPNTTMDADSKIRLIAKELRRMVQDQELGERVEDLSEIYLYGEAVDDEVLEGLQNTYDLQISRANPFRKIKVKSSAKEDIATNRSERYMIAVGAALRGIQ